VVAIGVDKTSDQVAEKVLAYEDGFVRITARIPSDVTAIGWAHDPITFVGPMYDGRIRSRCTLIDYSAVVSVRPPSLGLADAGEQRSQYAEWQTDLSPVKTWVIRVEQQSKDKVDLMERDIIISGGRGVKAAEIFTLFEELATGGGAAVGASRLAMEANWRGRDDQAGKSGKSSPPTLHVGGDLGDHPSRDVHRHLRNYPPHQEQTECNHFQLLEPQNRGRRHRGPFLHDGGTEEKDQAVSCGRR
jgi:hypothetical protein